VEDDRRGWGSLNEPTERFDESLLVLDMQRSEPILQDSRAGCRTG